MVNTIICDIGTINVRFYLLDVLYLHEYRRIIPNFMFTHLIYLVHLCYETFKTPLSPFALFFLFPLQ